jgi:hypothetical protein
LCCIGQFASPRAMSIQQWHHYVPIYFSISKVKSQYVKSQDDQFPYPHTNMTFPFFSSRCKAPDNKRATRRCDDKRVRGYKYCKHHCCAYSTCHEMNSNTTKYCSIRKWSRLLVLFSPTFAQTHAIRPTATIWSRLTTLNCPSSAPPIDAFLATVLHHTIEASATSTSVLCKAVPGVVLVERLSTARIMSA